MPSPSLFFGLSRPRSFTLSVPSLVVSPIAITGLSALLVSVSTFVCLCHCTMISPRSITSIPVPLSAPPILSSLACVSLAWAACQPMQRAKVPCRACTGLALAHAGLVAPAPPATASFPLCRPPRFGPLIHGLGPRKNASGVLMVW
ncbi:hypothetical protein GQ53DRAFT_753315, partial [Thozetella sp. PMI_491]